MMSIALVLLLGSAGIQSSSEVLGSSGFLGDMVPRNSEELRGTRGTDTLQLPDGTYVATTEAPEVVVARIGADGKPVMACVDNARAMQRFLDRGKKKASEK